MVGLAGCDAQQVPNTESVKAAGEGTGVPATYLIDKDDNEVVAINGRTFEIEFAGEAGEDDGAVLKAVAEAMENRDRQGRVFIKNAVYEIRELPSEGLMFSLQNAEIVSDFARLRFHEHTPIDDRGNQIDFALRNSTNVRVSGLILDGHKSERENQSRTLVIDQSENIAIENSVIMNGHGDTAGGGYGTATSDSTHVTYHNCVMRDNDRHGMHPGAGPTPQAGDFRITNCTFLHNGWAGEGREAAINGDFSPGFVIANNYFAENAAAISLWVADEPERASLQHAAISDNIFLDNGRPNSAQLNLGPDSTTADGTISIRGNHFELTDATGEDFPHVLVQDVNSEGRITVTDNSVTGGKSLLDIHSSADGRGSGTVRIENNEFDQASGPLLNLDGVSTYIVQNNLIASGPLIGEHAMVGRGVVRNNVLLDSSIGVEADGRDDVRIEHNVELSGE